METEQHGLQVSDAHVGSQLAQVCVVNASGGLVTIDFVYVHPRQSEPGSSELQGQVVSRMTMTYADAKSLAATLGEVLAKHGKKFQEQ